MAHPPLGAQLIVFSRQVDVNKEIASVLDAVAAAGFGAIECGVTTGAEDPTAFRQLLRDRGLAVAGMHGGLDQDVEQTLRLAELYAVHDICISSLGGWENTLADNYRRDLERFNEMARIYARHGIMLHYHNHAYEFAPSNEGPTGMEIILEGLDRSVAGLCVDVAWVHIGGSDPATFLREHADVIHYVHLKDYQGERHWTELGRGIVPLREVMAAIEALPDVRWAVYEQDTSDRPAAESCAISYRYLAENFGYR